MMITVMVMVKVMVIIMSIMMMAIIKNGDNIMQSSDFHHSHYHIIITLISPLTIITIITIISLSYHYPFDNHHHDGQ